MSVVYSIDALRQKRAEAAEDAAGAPWLVVKERCRSCGYKCIGVVPFRMDRDRAECGGCGLMTSSVTHFLADDNETWIERLEAVQP